MKLWVALGFTMATTGASLIVPLSLRVFGLFIPMTKLRDISVFFRAWVWVRFKGKVLLLKIILFSQQHT